TNCSRNPTRPDWNGELFPQSDSRCPTHHENRRITQSNQACRRRCVVAVAQMCDLSKIVQRFEDAPHGVRVKITLSFLLSLGWSPILSRTQRWPDWPELASNI